MTIETIQRVKIINHVSFVVFSINDFTGKIITNNLKIWAEGEKIPIKKTDGYFVFTNIEKQKVILHAEGAVFQEICIEVNLSKEENEIPIIPIRLIPNSNYPLPLNAAILYGKLKPDFIISTYSIFFKSPYKLLNDYVPERNKKEIQIFHLNKSKLEAKKFFIIQKERKELLEIRREKGEYSYLLQEILQWEYKKTETKILPVFQTKTDKNGRFYLPIGNLEKECIFQIEINQLSLLEKEYREVILKPGLIKKIEEDL